MSFDRAREVDKIDPPSLSLSQLKAKNKTTTTTKKERKNRKQNKNKKKNKQISKQTNRKTRKYKNRRGKKAKTKALLILITAELTWKVHLHHALHKFSPNARPVTATPNARPVTHFSVCPVTPFPMPGL